MEPTKAPWASSQPQQHRPVAKPGHEETCSSTGHVEDELDENGYCVPRRRIRTEADLSRFNRSLTHVEFVDFIKALAESVKGRPLSVVNKNASESSILIKTLKDWLIQMREVWLEEAPPVQHSVRYGNPAFRTWCHRLTSSSRAICESILPEDKKGAAVELAPYLEDSFGNATRIDYGTGHETNFCLFLFALASIGAIVREELGLVVGQVFVEYLRLMRAVQTTYWLEPAGSKGVWSLDDYHFIPFIIGAAQLVDHKYIKPKSIHSEDVLEGYAQEYLYLHCIAFIRKMKTGRFEEHSPLLNDVSGVQQWAKVYSGMLKMYQAHVLEKFPIMQHTLFGSIIKF